MNVGDVLRVTACGKVLGEQMCNVIYLVVATWTGETTPQEAFEAWVLGYMEDAARLQTSDAEWNFASFSNVTTDQNYGDFVVEPPIVGDSEDHCMPPYVALSFRQNRNTKATRHGYKRISGLPESAQSNGILTLDPTYQSAVSQFAATVGLPVGGPGWSFRPVIAGRTPSGGVDFARINSVASVSPQPELTTQNTRKYGRGS